MKKTILFFGMILSMNLGFSQFNQSGTTGTALTNNVWRTGAVGLGYTSTTLPFATTTATNTKLWVNGNSYFSGNIGVGTTTPSSALHLPSGQLTVGNYFTHWGDGTSYSVGIKANKSICIKSETSQSNSLQFWSPNVGSFFEMAISGCTGCYSTNAVSGDAIVRTNPTTPNSLIISNSNNGTIKFETGSTEVSPSTTKIRMMIDKDGNVGIGTGSAAIPSTDKLAVNGLIHTKEVKVDLIGWPDYVFEKEYELMPLAALEKQIKENKHLPEIPSAKEVEENGVMLGEMNKKLLQKVEELTLYIIQMNKEIELLKLQVNK